VSHDTDIYYREGAADFAEVFSADQQSFLCHVALLLFTPDAIVSRQVVKGYQLLLDAGFVAVAVRTVVLTPHIIRAIWAQELTEMSLDRLALCDHLLSATESLAVLLTDTAPISHIPASQRITDFKGAGLPGDRRPGTLRALLYSPNSVFRLVHTSDDPYRMIREIGILFNHDDRMRLLKDVRSGVYLPLSEIDAISEHVCLSVGARGFDKDEAFHRVHGLVAEAFQYHADDPYLRAANENLVAIAADQAVSWKSLYSTLQATDLVFDPWDLIVIGAWVISANDFPSERAANAR
jgi:nucleoside diphosphate kinase